MYILMTLFDKNLFIDHGIKNVSVVQCYSRYTRALYLHSCITFVYTVLIIAVFIHVLPTSIIFMDFAYVRKYSVSLASKFWFLTKKGYKSMDANACSHRRNSLFHSKHKDCFTISGWLNLFDAAGSFLCHIRMDNN